jgi:hypothetical protein
MGRSGKSAENIKREGKATGRSSKVGEKGKGA